VEEEERSIMRTCLDGAGGGGEDPPIGPQRCAGAALAPRVARTPCWWGTPPMRGRRTRGARDPAVEWVRVVGGRRRRCWCEHAPRGGGFAGGEEAGVSVVRRDGHTRWEGPKE
jgi:hypothetical protein